MPLSYFSVAAEEEFWSEHWGGHSVAELLAVARTSPLTTLICGALPAEGLVLEAGCGLGQYVLLLRERGWRVVGVDWSHSALQACRGAAAAPVAAMELRALAARDGAFAAYVSLGVVEHDPAGPDAILAEAARVLERGGTALVSVPYLNGVRRLTSPYIAYRNRAIARSGGRFYQFAFSRAELVSALERHGFAVRGLHPYDPGRLLWRLVPAAARAPRDALAGAHTASRPRGGLKAVVRGLLYTEPALRLLGHMLLAVAVRR
jgi:SAM-dependent methyltransferase